MAELGSEIADYQLSTEKLYEHKNLEHIIQEVLRHINFSSSWMMKCPIGVNIERDRFEIQKYKLNLKKDSLLEKFPQIVKEWHPTKNGDLDPSMFKPGSDHKVWWNCPDCDYEYESTISHRTYGTGCPKCKQLEENAKKAVELSGVNATIEKVTDLNKIMDYGVMMTPAIVIDEVVKSAGKILNPEEIKKFLI